MKGLKFLFNSWRSMSFFFWFAAVFSLAFAVLPFFFHEAHGGEDYLFPKIFIFFPSFMMAEIGLICGCRDIAANKLVRSFPIAKELYTKSVPLYVLLLTLGISAIVMAAYFIFLGIIGAEECHFADTLLISALFIAPMLITSAFFASVPGGGLLCVYAAALPIVLIATVGDDTVMRDGFGYSFPAAALISAALIAAGAALMFLIVRRRFRTSNFRSAPVMNYDTM